MTDNPQSERFEDNLREKLGETGGWTPGALNANEANDKVARDALTKLESRDEIARHLQDITKNNLDACLLFVDVDHFKEINDSHTHEVGDVVLENLGLRISGKISAKDHAGRWGGEEFLVVFEGLNNLETAKQRAEQIRASVADNPLSIDKVTLPITVSIGVSSRRLGETYKEWVKRADKAMYLAKESGRNQVKTERDLINTNNV